MSDSINKMSEVFLDEAHDLLDNLEDYLLELESNPEDNETISAVFRSMHTIKGSAAMFGFDDVSKFTHEVETAFDEVRNGKVKVTSQLITLTLNSRDHIRTMLDDAENTSIPETSTELITEFKKYIAEHRIGLIEEQEDIQQESIEKETRKQNSTTTANSETATEETTWRILFAPDINVFINGTRPHALLGELRDLGSSTITPFFKNVPHLNLIDPCKCYMYWEIVLTTKESLDTIKDVFIFLDKSSKVEITKIAEYSEHSPEIVKKIGEVLVDKNIVTEEQITESLGKQKNLGTILAEEKLVSKEDISAALAEQSHIKEQNEKKNTIQNSQTVKVNSEKLDKLIDLVGELVTFNARLMQLTQEDENTQLITLSEQGERLILELRDTTMDMRMLPIGSIFSRFRRLVRDLSSNMKKDIELITEGAETELDKTVIEKLNDPLVHLIRNSVDHGIESPEIREKNGKPASGNITLKAQHAGAFVLIIIEDDGAGLDTKKIRQKAIEKGLILPTDELTDSEIGDLIFLPGFSTADKVTSVSGRGVGMDVVKRDITALGGTVSTSSVQEKGTRFTLKLPLTLAIIEGIQVQIGEFFYVLPLSNVVECLEFTLPDETGKYCSAMKIRDEMIPYIDLRTFFKIESQRPEKQQIVIATDQDSKIGIVIDKVIGNYQTVIKPLGRLYQHVQGLSGATILGDGSVALILDVYKLSDIIKEIDSNS